MAGLAACSTGNGESPYGAGSSAGGGTSINSPGAAGGTPNDAASSGTSPGQGGTTGTSGSMRDIPSLTLVKEMGLGWNLGNTLDSTADTASVVPDETYWGNPKTTQAMIDTVKAAGFSTVRVPVTWKLHMGAAPDYTVNAAWMARVEEVVNYALSTGMYAIVNSHHDDWVSLMPTANQAAVSDQLSKLWTQIATRFRSTGDHLVFEVLNEPRTKDGTEWTGGTAAARQILNAYNLAAVNAIRATGGNNSTRHIMVPTHAANASTTCISELVIPNNDARVIVSLHTYYPYTFSAGAGATAWGTNAENADMLTELDRIASLLTKQGRATVIGEWGSVNQNNLSSRETHARAYSEAVLARGMAAIWWDNGVSTAGSESYGLLNRKVNPPTWYFPSIVQSLVAGAAAGAAVAP